MNIEGITNSTPTMNFKAKCVVLDRTKTMPQGIIKQCKDTLSTAGNSTDCVIIEINKQANPIIGGFSTVAKAFLSSGENHTKTIQAYHGSVTNFINDIKFKLSCLKDTVPLTTYKKAAPFLYDGKSLELNSTSKDIYGFITDEIFENGASRHYTYGNADGIGLYRYISEEKYPDGTIKSYNLGESKVERFGLKGKLEYTNDELNTIEEGKRMLARC